MTTVQELSIVDRARQITARARERREASALLHERASDNLPKAPFALWLGRRVARFGDEATAQALGVEPHDVHWCCYGAGNTISLGVVDRLLTAADEPQTLAILYPLDTPRHERRCESCRDVATTNDDLKCPWCESETT